MKLPNWFSPNQTHVDPGTFALGLAITATLALAVLKALGWLSISWWLVAAPILATLVFLIAAAAYFIWHDATKLDCRWRHPGA